MILTEMSDAAIHAKVQLKELEHQERMNEKKYQHERYKIDKADKRKRKEEKNKLRSSLIVIVICVAVFLGVFRYFDGEEKKSI